MRFTYYLYVYSWKILFIDDWRVVATDPPFAFVRCVRAHTGGAREGRARSRAAGEMHGGSLQTRGGDWFGSLPLGTKSVLLLNVCLYVLCVLFGYDAFHEVCMAPHWVLHQLQVYRILTAPLFHGGIIHLAFNMTAFVPMASSLERLLGSVQFLHIVFLFVALSSCFHVALAVIAGAFGFNAMHECAIGFSGVVFGVIVVDTHLQMVPRRSVFGFFQVPSQYYPVSLLLFLQVIIPSVSFLGHLAGLLAGSAYVSGYLNPLLLRQTTVAAFEGNAHAAAIARNPSFVAGGASADASPGAGGAAFPAIFGGGGGAVLTGGAQSGGDAQASRWWQMPTFARRGAPDSQEAFANGRAWTARTAPEPPAPARPKPNAAAAAAAAAEARAGTRAAGASLPARRATEPSPPSSLGRDDDEEDATMESMETAATSAMTSTAAAAAAAEAGAGADDPALDALVDMGFARDRARAALDAAGGDIAGAVDALSHA